jgi:hypothetical protein
MSRIRAFPLTTITKQQANTRMQHDRFAREIVGISALSRATRSRRLMRNPLGRHSQRPSRD